LVKTIGDAIMFVSPDAGALIDVMVDLRNRVHNAEPGLPEVRMPAASTGASVAGGR
jgi:hypothetical protein